MNERTTTPANAAAFARCAAPGVAVPVVRELGAQRLDPLAAFLRLAADEPAAALLETAEAGEDRIADMSVVIPRARRVLRGDDVLDQVRAMVCDTVADIGVELPRFLGGAVGMLGHEHVRSIEPTVPRAVHPHPAGLSEAAFLEVDTCVVFDHGSGRVRAVAVVRVPAGAEPGDSEDDVDEFDAATSYARAVAALDEIERILDEPVEHVEYADLDETTDLDAGVVPNIDDAEFERLVETTREHVLGGECVQIVISRRFERVNAADPALVYRALRHVSPAPYHVLMRLDGAHVVSASPEQLVGVHGERVVTHPIAGTRPRGADSASDAEHEGALRADPKERSEHMMLVDLGRNDLGRVAVPGTVRVERLCEVERFSHVMHLVSRVEADLAPGLHPIDALRACFPAGTLTGAPKVRAMQLISELESDQRGSYGGVIGYVGHGRVLDMAIAIRMAVLAEDMAYVQAGAGVVAESDAAAEAAETRHKARGVLLAIAMANAATPIDVDANADALIG